MWGAMYGTRCDTQCGTQDVKAKTATKQAGKVRGALADKGGPADSLGAPQSDAQAHADGGMPPSWALDAEEDEHAVDALMGIAEVCERYQVSPRALRFYETKGLLAPRRINGTRVYSQVDRARLMRILRAKSLGSPLSEIKHYLDMYGQHGEGRIQQLTYVIEKTDKAIAELEAKRAQIEASLAELRLINERSRQTLAGKRGK
jgi:DNA-binding transcriptional MerR regulator